MKRLMYIMLCGFMAIEAHALPFAASKDMALVGQTSEGGGGGSDVLSYTNGIFAWFRAEDLLSTWSDGDSPTNWPDISGAGNDLSLVAGGMFNQLVDDAVGGRAAVLLTNTYFQTAAFSSAETVPVTVALVLKQTTLESSAVALDSLTSQRFTFYAEDTKYRIRLNLNGNVSTSPDTTNFYYYFIHFTQATNATYSALYRNNALLDAAVAAGGSTTLDGISLGSRAGASASGVDGYYSEAIYFDHDITTNRAAVADYFENYYPGAFGP